MLKHRAYCPQFCAQTSSRWSSTLASIAQSRNDCPTKFGFTDHSARFGPAVESRVFKLGETPTGSLYFRLLNLGFEALKIRLELLPEPIVTCQTKTVKHTVVFAPGHDRITGKTAIGTHDDTNLAAETLANGRHDLLQCLKGAVAGFAFAIPQPGKQRNVTAKTRIA
jgi:hypothetical protein